MVELYDIGGLKHGLLLVGLMFRLFGFLKARDGAAAGIDVRSGKR